MGGRCNGFPACVLGNEEDALVGVLVAVFLETVALGHQLLVALFELV